MEKNRIPMWVTYTVGVTEIARNLCPSHGNLYQNKFTLLTVAFLGAQTTYKSMKGLHKKIKMLSIQTVLHKVGH
jgi:hypothetical protein